MADDPFDYDSDEFLKIKEQAVRRAVKVLDPKLNLYCTMFGSEVSHEEECYSGIIVERPEGYDYLDKFTVFVSDSDRIRPWAPEHFITVFKFVSYGSVSVSMLIPSESAIDIDCTMGRLDAAASVAKRRLGKWER